MERWEGKDGHCFFWCWTNHKFPAGIFFNQMISWEAVDDLGLMWMWCTCTLQGTEACLTHTLTISILYTWLNINLELKSICVWSHAYIRCILGCNHIWCNFWYALPVIISGFSVCWVRKFDIWGTTFEWSCLQEYEERAVIITHVGHVSDPKKMSREKPSKIILLHLQIYVLPNLMVKRTIWNPSIPWF